MGEIPPSDLLEEGERAPERHTLHRTTQAFDELIGTWQIDAVWSDGKALWAQAEYRPVLGGAFVEARVFVRDGDGPLYRRYRSFFAGPDDPGVIIAHTFSADGSHAESRLQVDGPVITTEWSAGNTTIAERMELRAGLAGRFVDAEAWVLERDGQSTRRSILVVVGPDDDDGHPTMVTFAEDGSVSRAAVHSEADGLLTIERATPSGGQISQAAEMVSTNAFRWWVQVRDNPLSGWTEILSYIPDRMISFSWNAPPSQPDSRLARIWVVVETEAMDADHTRVRLTHLGFGEGPTWDETMAYFDKAWEYVLAQVESALTTE